MTCDQFAKTSVKLQNALSAYAGNDLEISFFKLQSFHAYIDLFCRNYLYMYYHEIKLYIFSRK